MAVWACFEWGNVLHLSSIELWKCKKIVLKNLLGQVGKCGGNLESTNCERVQRRFVLTAFGFTVSGRTFAPLLVHSVVLLVDSYHLCPVFFNTQNGFPYH